DPADGVAITNWADRSGNASHALQGAAANQPTLASNQINGLNAVRFDGNDRLVMGNITSRTIFAVTRVDTAAANLDGLIGAQCCDDGIRRNQQAGWRPPPGGGSDFANPGGSTFRVDGENTSLAAEGVWHIVEAIRGPNGQVHDAIGGYFNGRELHGDIAELMVYDQALSTADRHTVGFYLKTKYAIPATYDDPMFPIVRPANEIRFNMVDNPMPTTADVVGDLASTGAAPSSVFLLYGTTDAGTNINAWPQTNQFAGPITPGLMTNNLNGLAANTLYYFRYASTNALGTYVMSGPPGTFTTPSTTNGSTVVTNGLMAWLDAGTIGQTNNGPVDHWPDLTTNNNSAIQADPGEQPRMNAGAINGRPAVQFDNTTGGDVMGITDFSDQLLNTSATLFVVAEIANVHNYNLFSTRFNDARWREGTFTRMGTFRTTRIEAPGGFMPSSNAHIFEIESSAAHWEFFLDGQSVATAAPQFDAGAGFENILGGRVEDGQQRLNGAIAEVLIYDRVLSRTERQRIGLHLQQKYGISGSYLSPDVPTVDNANGATAITTDTALLNGTLTSTGSAPTIVEVYWGSTDGGTNRFAWANTNSFGLQGPGPLSLALAGLPPNADVFYRFSATNRHGRVWASASADFHTDLDLAVYSNRLKIAFCGYNRSSVLTNFPVLVELGTNIPGFDYTRFASPSGGDLRFADADQVTALDFDVEAWNTNGLSYIWVRLPTLSGPDDCIYAYWGNNLATNLPAGAVNGATWEPAYRGVWHMTEPNVVDASLPRNNGTPAGTVTNTPGLIADAQMFDDSHIDIANEQ
ncbi:MAG: DUF2341 domain-containing protein, partial [Verrucomicrobiota bacterium]